MTSVTNVRQQIRKLSINHPGSATLSLLRPPPDLHDDVTAFTIGILRSDFPRCNQCNEYKFPGPYLPMVPKSIIDNAFTSVSW